MVTTDCDTGLGQEMATGLAEASCDIVGVNIVEPDETLRQEAHGHRFLSTKADLSDTAVIPGIIAQAVAAVGYYRYCGKIINIASMLPYAASDCSILDK